MATRRFVIRVPGEPKGKGRPRFTTRGGFAKTFTPKATREYEEKIREFARQAMIGREAIDRQHPVAIDVTAVFQIPKSWSQKRRVAALGCDVMKRPDLDNIIKEADALIGIVFPDDSQISRISARKIYGFVPSLQFIITEMPLPCVRIGD